MRKFSLFMVLPLLVLACTDNANHRLQSGLYIDDLVSSAKFSMSVAAPVFPDAVFNVMDYGADATGQTLTTDALQTAIDSCNAAGGGTVLLPGGVYFTGPIVLKSNVRLLTEKNTFVLFSSDYNLYPIYDTSFEGIDTKRCQSPISAFGAENIAIVGEGTFNGAGDEWRPLKKAKVTGGQWKKQLEKGGVVTEDGKMWYRDSAALYAASLCVDQNVPVIDNDATWDSIHSFLRPVLVHLVNCKNILLEGVGFENSPAWNLHPLMCENLILSSLTIRNPWYSQNGDGVDVESCKNVLIDHCSFDVGDDAICMKSGKNEDGRRRGIPCENVLVNACTVYHGHGGFVVGSEMSGGVKNIEVRNCLFIGTDVGLRFKSTRGRGGIVENIYIDGVNMWGIPNDGLLFDLFYGGKGAGEETEEEIAARMSVDVPPVTEETPQFRDIYISNVVGSNVARAIYFNGLPEMKIENVNLENISMTCTTGAILRQTNGLRVKNVQLTPKQGEPFVIAPTVENIVFED